MLQINNITKTYQTGDLLQKALDSVTLNLRDNEFVAILGPSGSGKTTLLNVIGGLDRYDSGELIINGISTKRYKDRDWDSYRNHTIGFVFQSYNLIAHQSILANVELALTISGIRRSERRQRAKEALEKVGLGDQLHKRPNQLSGGQMQRVAIARALVNDPDVLLADEPTGALDTNTSLQVMELLKQVAEDRLVVMVTHNPELAKQYATRIVKLHDGKITDDSHPYLPETEQLAEPKHQNMGKSSMSFRTALSLSFNNLRTKKGRTILTAFAGSIGIIGIALILSLSTGVNTYINDIQKSTMVSYPVSIQSRSFDFASLMLSGREARTKQESSHALDGVYTDGRQLELASGVSASIDENNLTAFKKYLDNPDSEIHQYIGENGIVYSYATAFSVYAYDPEDKIINTDGSTLTSDDSSLGQLEQANPMMSMMSMMGASENRNFKQLLPQKDGSGISPVVLDNYVLLYGSWPSAYNEVILTLDANNEISTATLYELGILPASEYSSLMEKIDKGEKLTLSQQKLSYEQVCAQELYLVPACDGYRKNEQSNYIPYGQNETELKELLSNAIRLKISGIVRSAPDTDSDFIGAVIGYSQALTDYLITYTENSEVVKAQKADKDVNIFNGLHFKPSDDEQRAADALTYLSSLGVSQKALVCKQLLVPEDDPIKAAQMMSMSESELAALLDASLPDMDKKTLLSFYDAAVPAGSYDDNLKALGVVSLDAPSSIDLYADSFEDKDEISLCIERYNATASEEDNISYTDYVGLIMSSVTEIINVISYVLIAFVAVSLVVSSIMIGIITYISVLERTKEIGILRAIGASRRNISQVFNAETFIVGFISGLMGIGITLLLLLPGNLLIHSLADTADINAQLPIGGAVILIILSMLLTLIGGLIPSKKAAKRDPVTALRTE